jgi:hypothetical protein
LNGTNTLLTNSYVIAISGTAAGAAVKTRDLTFIINTGVSPVVTSHPTNQTTCVGNNATFTAAATNASGYQWQVSTAAVPAFTDIAGATSVSYTINSAIAGMDGNQYRVIVTTTCAPSATSNAAILTVVNPVSITAQPVSVETCSGNSSSFTVAGSSTQTINYQWQVNIGTGFVNVVNTAPYAGATTATLAITGSPISMNGYQFRCLLSNTTCTSTVTSASAAFTVRQLPAVGLVAAPSLSLLPGKSAILIATPSAQTTGTLTTSWFKNGTAFANTGNTYTADVEKTGSYQVKIQEVFSTGFICSNQSPVVAIDAAVSSKLFILPSLSDGQFIVSYYNNGGSSIARTVAVYDSRGSKIYNKGFTVAGPYTLLTINIKPAQKGIYYVVVGDAAGKKMVAGKLLVQ